MLFDQVMQMKGLSAFVKVSARGISDQQPASRNETEFTSMPFDIAIPRTNGREPLQTQLAPGNALFLLGANGTGKSSLVTKLNSVHRNSRRISAHRKMWFEDNAIDITPAQSKQLDQNIRNQDAQMRSRYREEYADQRASKALFDLISAENTRARDIAEAMTAKNIARATDLAEGFSPLAVLNRLMNAVGLSMTISILRGEEINASKNGSAPFNLARLSDGERNGLLLAANVLTSPPDTLLLVDEPERHLHRSIISPLLTLLVAERPDCSFIISTHEVMLPIDNPSSSVLLVRACEYAGDEPVGWDVDLVSDANEIGEDVRRHILGGRRKLVFVEGEEESLDKTIYTLLFPEVTVAAKRSSREVEQSVAGIRGSQELHWVSAFGIVDRDGRDAGDIQRLEQRSVYPLSVYSVESLYYHPRVVRRVASLVAKLHGARADALLDAAMAAAFASLRPHLRRLSARAIEKRLRWKVESSLPRWEAIEAGQPFALNINLQAERDAEIARLEARIAALNFSEILGNYPVRETGALNAIANGLRFQTPAQYEAAVRKLLTDDAQAAEEMRQDFGGLLAAIAAN
jgi:ABC-type molybdenum transport system ATPase subunit/photorepair protein PhrA